MAGRACHTTARAARATKTRATLYFLASLIDQTSHPVTPVTDAGNSLRRHTARRRSAYFARCLSKNAAISAKASRVSGALSSRR